MLINNILKNLKKKVTAKLNCLINLCETGSNLKPTMIYLGTVQEILMRSVHISEYEGNFLFSHFPQVTIPTEIILSSANVKHKYN